MSLNILKYIYCIYAMYAVQSVLTICLGLSTSYGKASSAKNRRIDIRLGSAMNAYPSEDERYKTMQTERKRRCEEDRRCQARRFTRPANGRHGVARSRTPRFDDRRSLAQKLRYPVLSHTQDIRQSTSSERCFKRPPCQEVHVCHTSALRPSLHICTSHSAIVPET